MLNIKYVIKRDKFYKVFITFEIVILLRNALKFKTYIVSLLQLLK